MNPSYDGFLRRRGGYRYTKEVQEEVVHEESRVEDQKRPEPNPGESKILVYHEQQEPESDEKTLLDQEGPGAIFQQPFHERIAFRAATPGPLQGKERVCDVEGQDAADEGDN